MFDVEVFNEPIVLDGGLSTALEQQGANLGGALWTARLLGEEPERIAAAHRAFYEAGARVATTASYQASVDGLVEAGYDAAEARRLITLSVTIARDVRAELAETTPGLLVAASVGPYGAYLADGSEYTGRYDVPAVRLRDFHAPRLDLLAEAAPDVLAVETIPDADEAEVLVALARRGRAARLVQLLRARHHDERGPTAGGGVRRPGRQPSGRRGRRQLLRPGRRARCGAGGGGRDRTARRGLPEPRRQLGRRRQDVGLRRSGRPRPGRVVGRRPAPGWSAAAAATDRPTSQRWRSACDICPSPGLDRLHR